MGAAAVAYEDAPGGSAAGAVAANQFVAFSVGANAFGIDIMAVQEIRSWSPLVALPDQPFGACGVLDIRGRVIEIYDLSALMGGPQSAPGQGHVVLVLALGERSAGIVVDSVSDIIFAGPEDFRDAPRNGGEKISGLVKRGEQLVAILNLPALFPGFVDAD